MIPGLGNIKLLGAVVGIAATVAAIAVVTHKIDDARYKALELSVAEAHAKALQQALDEQKRLDQVAADAARREAAEQAAIAADIRRQLAEVKRHVVAPVAPYCVPYGLVRVLVAASRGVSADSLPLPAGKSDGSCTALEWSDLAAALVADYGIARGNAEQLDALSRWYEAAKR